MWQKLGLCYTETIYIYIYKATTINALEMWYNDKSVPMENRQFSKNKNSVEPDFKRMHSAQATVHNNWMASQIAE